MTAEGAGALSAGLRLGRGIAEGRKRLPVATQTVGPNPDTRISVGNAPERVGLERLAWMRRQRYREERAFQDAKDECGIDD